MRILVATDGSDAAGVGCDLARDLATLAHGEIRIVAVVPPTMDLFGGVWPLAGVVDPQPLERAARDKMADRLSRAVDRMPADLRPTSALLGGRPADEIVAEATRWPADIVVIASRGHGQLSSIVLGSVSEEVVTRSPIPVLVARQPRLRRIVVGVDGSAASQAAVDFLTSGATFQGLDAWVVDVAPSTDAWWLGLATADSAIFDRFIEMNEHTRLVERESAERASQTLRDAGLVANSRHRIGDAADELVRAAAELGADTILIGSRGPTGIGRLAIGSVARHVLRHADASVLIVHSAPVTQHAEPDDSRGVPVGASR